MRKLLVVVLVSICTGTKTKRGVYLEEIVSPERHSRFCDAHKDMTVDYRAAITNFTIKLYKTASDGGNYHFVYSPFTIWRILSAFAEGSDTITKEQLFKFLNLPNDLCTRRKYYDIASQRIKPGDDVDITSMRALVVDEDLKMNYHWMDFVSKHLFLDVVSAPIKKYPQIAANHMRRLMSSPLPKLNLNGNSVILDSVAYDGLWTTAFSDAVIERSPFYDQLGRKIGSVDLMTMKKRVRMAYLPSLQAKVLELPVGLNKRYRMLFGMILSRNFAFMLNNLPGLMDIMDGLKESNIPLDVAIPRFTLISDIDVRSIMEDAGISNLWTNPGASQYVSKPAALPSSFLQRTTLKLSTQGLYPAPLVQEPLNNATTGLDPIVGRDFIANRPFMFALLDAETYTCLITATYTQPTYAY